MSKTMNKIVYNDVIQYLNSVLEKKQTDELIYELYKFSKNPDEYDKVLLLQNRDMTIPCGKTTLLQFLKFNLEKLYGYHINSIDEITRPGIYVLTIGKNTNDKIGNYKVKNYNCYKYFSHYNEDLLSHFKLYSRQLYVILNNIIKNPDYRD